MGKMKAVLLRGHGGTDVMEIGEAPMPEVREGEVLIRVRAFGLNRADLLQRRGQYPPPPGVPDIPGLEAAGIVAALGPGVKRVRVGDPVCVLLPGGGYAEYAAAPEGMVMPVPEGLSLEEAAAIPEAFLTAFLNLFRLGKLRAGETVLIHAGASGVGTAAIQLANLAGGRVLVTAGSAGKLKLCRELGAQDGWNYHDGSFRDWVRQATGGRGADLVLDLVGGPYLQDNLFSLAPDGRLVVVGTMGGASAENIHLGLLLTRRLRILGTTLRSQPVETKIRLTQSFMHGWLPAFRTKRLVPVIDSVWDWTRLREAHEHMEAGRNLGKIVLRIPHES